jgi:peroxiredoxin
MPALHVVGDPQGRITANLPTQVTPTLFLFGKWGEVRYMGGLEAESFRTMVDALLSETKPDEKNIFLRVPLEAGEVLPAFRLNDTRGESVALTDRRRDAKALVLAFIGRGCDASQEALEELSNMALLMEEDGIRVLAVHVGEPDPATALEYNDLNLPFPVLLDPGGKVADLYAIDAKPTLFVADADGKITLRTLWHAEAVDQEVQILTGLMDESERRDFAGEGSG